MAAHRNRVSRNRYNEYCTTEPQLDALYAEIQTLMKKKPDGTLNPLKVQMINRVLTDLRALLKGEPAEKYLILLDDETLPQHSDVALILAQYKAALSSFRSRYTYLDDDRLETRWSLKD